MRATWKRGFSDAVRDFWKRDTEAGAQRRGRDQGRRTAVTGGKNLDPVRKFFAQLIVSEAGVSEDDVHLKESRLSIPGYFRPNKKWDLVVVHRQHLLAALELKSMLSSYGNNLNNRAEEAVGAGFDFKEAGNRGVLPVRPHPWLGFFFLMNSCEQSSRPITRIDQPHFPVMESFQGASYVDRASFLLERLVDSRLFSCCTLVLSSAKMGNMRIPYQSPYTTLGIEPFVASMLGTIRTNREVVDATL